MQFRAVFISDVHLGTRWCKVKYLSSFLSCIECDELYLVGDIIDGWHIRRKGKWPQSHNKIVRKLLKMSRDTKITYVTGNHDEFMDEFDQYNFGRIAVCRKAFYTSSDGRKFLVVHGDEYDIVVKYNKWLVTLGDYAYDVALWVNAGVNRVRSVIGKDYWSLSQNLKHRVKDAVKYIGAYETCLLKAAGKNGVDGIICGHIHRPAMRRIGNISYFNTGDWVETCSALVENMDGTFEIIRWYGTEIERIPIVTSDGELVFRKEGITEPAPM